MKKIYLALMLITTSSCGFLNSPSTFFSKEMCSCIFIENQSEKYCQNYLNIFLPVWSHKVDTVKKEVYSSGYFNSNTAKFKNRMLGCQIVSK